MNKKNKLILLITQNMLKKQHYNKMYYFNSPNESYMEAFETK